MVLLLRFIKIHIAKSIVSYNLNAGVRGAIFFRNIRKPFDILTQFELVCNKLQNWASHRKFDNSELSFCKKADERIIVPTYSEGMKFFSKRLLGIIPSFTKKKKSSRRKKAFKKAKKSSSLTGKCSQFSITVHCSDLSVPKSAANTSSSPTSTMALSYRDVLTNNLDAPKPRAEGGTNVILKNVRSRIKTPYGRWIDDGWLDVRATKGTRIKVLSYNILAQCLLETHRYLYLENEEKYLTWEYRSRALMQEFAEFDADILCLQEVEASKLDFFNSELMAMGYKGAFKKRTGDKEDGCAIYYRQSKFEVKELVPVEYYQPGVHALNRDNVGLIALLKPKDNPRKNIVVATTHLLFNPRRHDVKLAQTQIILAEIERVAFKCVKDGQTMYHPIILTGDFNLRPSTPVYHLITNGNVPMLDENPVPPYLGISTSCQHRDVISHRYPECREDLDERRVQLYNSERKHQPLPPLQQYPPQELNWRRRDNGLSHKLSLNSVYPHRDQALEDASTFQDPHWCTVDYIFYGPVKTMRNGERVDGDLKLMSYLRLPNCQEANNLKAIPNESCASDHMPLLATFHLPIQE